LCKSYRDTRGGFRRTHSTFMQELNRWLIKKGNLEDSDEDNDGDAVVRDAPIDHRMHSGRGKDLEQDGQ
jgi:hypothetical protein